MNTSSRTLFVTVMPPYPATSGAPLRNWQNIQLAAATGPVAVLSISGEPANRTELPGVVAYRHVTIPREIAGSVRGFPHLTGTAATVIGRAVSAMCREFGPSVIVLENVWIDRIMPIARAAGAPLVFDAHNVYVALAEQLEQDVAAVRALEATAVASADVLWVCSDDDAERMRTEYATLAPLRVVPNGIDTAYYQPVRSRRPRPARNVLTMLFVGSYWYEPNRHAAHVLLDEIVPAVRERTDADVRLHLVGAAPSERMRASRDPGLTLTGRVADVRPYLGFADVVVVPLHHGGGTRLKLLEAFAACRPVVATAKAAEGIDVGDDRHLLVREDAASIADAVLALWRQPDLAERLTREAFALVEARYAWSALSETVGFALVEAALGAGHGPVRKNGSRTHHFA